MSFIIGPIKGHQLPKSLKVNQNVKVLGAKLLSLKEKRKSDLTYLGTAMGGNGFSCLESCVSTE